jgi:hypothetical protein
MAEVTNDVNVTCPVCGLQQTVRGIPLPEGMRPQLMTLSVHESNGRRCAGTGRGVRPE